MKRTSFKTTAGSALAVVFVFLLAGCTDAVVQPKPEAVNNVDDRLTLAGRVCSDTPDPTGFPVKVVVIIDESGSMCVSDPPGSQEGSGFCEQAAVQAIIPPGVTEPARVRALRRLLQQFSTQPNVSVSIVPFETNVKNTWPQTVGQGQSRFVPASDVPDTYIAGLQNQLGKGTDYQGALSYAYRLVSGDIADTAEQNPEVLPRTRYVVVFLTDGTPYPRCSANDNLPPTSYATPSQPDLIWADSSSAVDFCNGLDFGNDAIDGFDGGVDRNQNYQLFSLIDKMMELKDQYNVGDIRLHTVLLFNEAAVQACGSICQDLYGTYPGVAQAQYPQAAKQIASWTLQQFAQRGNGIYQEFNNGNIQNLGLGALNYTSLSSPFVMKTLMVQSLSSFPGENGRVVDSDGDGLPDTVDNKFTYATSPYLADSDSDGFDDMFEHRHKAQGFEPANDKDSRGCDPASPLTPGCNPTTDTDGDELTQWAEDYLKTRPGIQDSDSDGIPDGMEVRFGLDPLKRDADKVDTDGDGISDADEIKAGSDPTRPDHDFYDRYGYLYETTADPQADGSICYDFSVSNIQLVTPPSRAGTRQGFNLFKIWFAEAPQSGVATDYGVWRTACVWAQYDPPVREPAGSELRVTERNFRRPDQLNSEAEYKRAPENGGCVGVSQ
ncbi:MAG: cell-cell cohesion protein MtsD [Myxococcaceae bacterium]